MKRFFGIVLFLSSSVFSMFDDFLTYEFEAKISENSKIDKSSEYDKVYYVGIAHKSSNLMCPHNDIRLISQLFESDVAYKLLSESKKEVFDKIDSLVSDINKLPLSEDSKILIVFHISCHGIYKEGNFFILLKDDENRRKNEELNIKDITNKVESLEAKAKILYIVDTCNSYSIKDVFSQHKSEPNIEHFFLINKRVHNNDRTNRATVEDVKKLCNENKLIFFEASSLSSDIAIGLITIIHQKSNYLKDLVTAIDRYTVENQDKINNNGEKIELELLKGHTRNMIVEKMTNDSAFIAYHQEIIDKPGSDFSYLAKLNKWELASYLLNIATANDTKNICFGDCKKYINTDLFEKFIILNSGEKPKDFYFPPLLMNEIEIYLVGSDDNTDVNLVLPLKKL